jgi:hypothetical protein
MADLINDGDNATAIESTTEVTFERVKRHLYYSIMSVLRWFLFLTLAFCTAAGQEGGQPEEDAHRPPCNSAQCRKVKSFVKTHYCGAPQGNGPDDSCEIRQPKKRLNIKMTANYDCMG